VSFNEFIFYLGNFLQITLILETLSTYIRFRFYIDSVRKYWGSFPWLNSKRTHCPRSLQPTLWRSQPTLTKGSCWSTTAADEPAGIAGIIHIQSTFQKEEPVMTGAVVRIAGDIPVTSASDSPFSNLFRSLLQFIEILIVNQSRRSPAIKTKKLNWSVSRPGLIQVSALPLAASYPVWPKWKFLRLGDKF
jgi:hypothetical protein